jgi:hypothetical protein
MTMISFISRCGDLSVILRKCETREFVGKDPSVFQDAWVSELLGESVPFSVRVTMEEGVKDSESEDGCKAIWICLPWEYRWIIQDGDLHVYKGTLPIDDAPEPDIHLRKILKDTEDWFKPPTHSDIVDKHERHTSHTITTTATKPKQKEPAGIKQQWGNPLNSQGRTRDTIVWRSRVV